VRDEALSAPHGAMPLLPASWVADERARHLRLGDVLQQSQELTPVAIKAGTLLARRLLAGASLKMDYSLVWRRGPAGASLPWGSQPRSGAHLWWPAASGLCLWLAAVSGDELLSVTSSCSVQSSSVSPRVLRDLREVPDHGVHPLSTAALGCQKRMRSRPMEQTTWR